MSSLVSEGRQNSIRLAMLGMVEGNGHPYSWSAMFNGYDEEKMLSCPYAVINDYLSKEPKDTLQIEGANVTHIWTDDPKDAEIVSDTCFIPNVVDDPTDVIGAVDAVIISTDDGGGHVDRARPFVEAGLPVFVDKPMVDNAEDLQVFRQWIAEGRPIMSSSCMRYAREFVPYHSDLSEIGEPRHVVMTMMKSWEKYGIHALEALYPIVGPGFVSLRNTGTLDHNVIHLTHESGVDTTVAVHKDMMGGYSVLSIYGTEGYVTVRLEDTFYAFKTQLIAFVEFLRSGEYPFPFAETDELMRMVIAGIESRESSGAEILLKNI